MEGNIEFNCILEQLAETIAAKLSARLLEHQAVEHTSVSRWMGVAKAAEYLDWPKQRLYKLTASGQIPHYKQDGRLLFRSDELDPWLEQFAEGERPQEERRSRDRATVVFRNNGSTSA